MSEATDEFEDESHDESGAERAFAELRAEVMGLRKSIEGLPKAIRGAAAPDYAPSFGAISNALADIGERLAEIEEHPALKLTPDEHGRAISRVGAEVMNAAARRLDEGGDDLRRVRDRLAAIVGAGLERQAQRRELCWALGGGVAVGLVLFPLLGAFAPGGSFLAALATGNADRFLAGASLIQAGSPERAAGLASATRLVGANADVLNACAEAAKKTGAAQKCTISVQVPGT